MDNNTLIFVYGTLKRGHGNNYHLKNSEFLGEAITSDKYALYDGGSFPYMSDNQELFKIKGELYSVDQYTLKDVDKLEGYREGDLHNFYTRKEIKVSMNDVEYTCYTYINNEPNGELIKNKWR